MQVREERRVKEYGEVFTSNKEITDMLDLIEHETFRIESRFLDTETTYFMDSLRLFRTLCSISKLCH